MIHPIRVRRFPKILGNICFFAIGVAVLASPIVLGKPPRAVARHAAEEEKTLVNVDANGLAIRGYDPVAYFSKNEAVRGDPAIASTVGRATYHFSSEENKAAFDKEPSKYMPAFGGFCGYGVAKGVLAPTDPTAFQIVEGKLILQYDANAVAIFSKDVAGYMEKAAQNWKKLLEEEGK